VRLIAAWGPPTIQLATLKSRRKFLCPVDRQLAAKTLANAERTVLPVSDE
jgi:hypothetical protein